MSGRAGGMGAAYRRARRREGGFALIAVMVSLVTLVAVFAGLQAAMLGPRLSLRALEREAREGLALEAALAEVRLEVAEALAGGGTVVVEGWLVRWVPGGVLVGDN